jgi:cytochrome P450
MTTTAGGLPAHLAHPFSPPGRADPYPAYDWLRAHDPVHRDPMTGMWLITSHADCTALLKHPGSSAAAGQRERSREDELPPSMLSSDGAEHARLRAPGALLLGPAALASVSEAIAADADALLGRAAGPGQPADPVEQLGIPLATAALARLFGIPDEQRELFAKLARAASVNLDPLAPPQVARLGRAAMGELTRYLDAHIAQAPHCPLRRLAEDPRLSRQEMLGILGLTVVGGWLPLAESIGNALHWLLPDAEARTALRTADRTADPATAETVMDELLRLDAPIPFTARVTTTEVRLPGGEVPTGQRVLVLLAAANRDPAVFPDPGRLVWNRSPNPHLAFGGGPHFCLAARLVRQSGAVLLGRLVRTFPEVAAEPAGRWAGSLIPRRLTGFGLRLGPTASTADVPAPALGGADQAGCPRNEGSSTESLPGRGGADQAGCPRNEGSSTESLPGRGGADQAGCPRNEGSSTESLPGRGKSLPGRGATHG